MKSQTFGVKILAGDLVGDLLFGVFGDLPGKCLEPGTYSKRKDRSVMVITSPCPRG